jgi:hypothetical protein
MIRKLPEPQAGSNTLIRDMRRRRFSKMRGLSPASSSRARRSSRKSGFSTFRMFGTLV